MITRRSALGVIGSALLPGTLRAADREPEFFKSRLEEGKLPPVAERLPRTPRIVKVASMGRQPGRHGGTVRTLIGGQKDIRLMTIYG